MNGSYQQIDRLAKATVFACRLHANDTRDDGTTPYAVHPVRVMEYMRRIAGEKDENVLCAALLHDTIEDCAINYDDVAREFGEDVANLVAELTNDNRLPKPERRAAMIEHLPQLTARAKRIKLADRLDNVLDLLRGSGTDEKRLRYLDETERILDALAGACAPLEQALRQALQELQASQPEHVK
jgi:GTP diphosphokinase / guanosine-3',5'-bis(diphosphate) 3'-diphosphatase